MKAARLLYMAPFITMADRFSATPLLIPIATELHVNVSAVAAMVSLYYIAYGLFPSVFGFLSDRFGRVRIIRGALAGVAIGDALSAFSPNLGILLLARFATGAVACGVLPISLVYVGDRFAFQVRQQAVADLLVWVALGTALGTIGAGLIAQLGSFRPAFLLLALLAGSVALALGKLPESWTRERTEGPVDQLLAVLAQPWALALYGLALVEGAVMFGFITFFAPALEAHGQTPAIAGPVVGAYGVAVLLGTRMFAAVSRRAAPPFLLGGGAALLGAGFLAAALNQGIPAILLASVLAGLAYAFMHSTFQTWATELVPRARGTSTSLFVMAVFAGAGIATYAVAPLAGSRNYSQLFVVAALATVPVMVLGWLARARYPGPPSG